MSKRRGSGFGVTPISCVELQAWASLRGITFEQFEINALDALEDLYLTKKPDAEADQGEADQS